jgi:hypothetical protein
MPGVPTPRPLRLVVVASIIAAVSFVGLPTGHAEDVLPVTEREARKIVAEHILQNEKNNNTLDVEGQGAIEAPPLRTIDDASFREHQGRGETSLGEEDVTIGETDVFIPDQSSYPLMFLASETFTSPDAPDGVQQLLLFEKPGPDDPWRSTMAAQMLEPIPDLSIDNFGLARLVGPKAAAKLEVKPASLPKKLAKLWTRTIDEPSPASATFESGPLTTSITQVLIFDLERMNLPESNADFEFAPAENQPICFGAHGGAFCFFVMSIREELTPSAGKFQQPAARDVLGGLIAPGQYGGARYEQLAIVTAFVPNRSRDELVRVQGFYSGPVHAEGTVGSPNTPTA